LKLLKFELPQGP